VQLIALAFGNGYTTFEIEFELRYYYEPTSQVHRIKTYVSKTPTAQKANISPNFKVHLPSVAVALARVI
jgi:hypothetical protein